jgi:sporulation protein YlmC with PRC-barrel domain
MNRTNILSAAAALILVAVPALAQTRPVEPTATSDRPIRLEAPSGSSALAPGRSRAPGAFDGMMAGSLIGRSVYNTGGESLGEIDDIVVRREDNEIAALVGMGRFLGVDAKPMALLLKDLEIYGDRIVVRDLTRTDFQQASAYQKDGWARHDPDRAIRNATLR